MERLSVWRPWYSLEMLKASFIVPSEYQGCHPDNLSVSVINSLRPSDAWLAPSHYLNQWLNIVDFNRCRYIFIQENAFGNVVWKMAAILFRPQCVNWTAENSYPDLNKPKHNKTMCILWDIEQSHMTSLHSRPVTQSIVTHKFGSH